MTRSDPPKLGEVESDLLNLTQCPVCGWEELSYAFQISGRRADRCPRCELFFLNPQPTGPELSEIYEKNYLIGDKDPVLQDRVPELKRMSARVILQDLCDYAKFASGTGKRLLDVGCGAGFLLAEAGDLGFEATGVDPSLELVDKAREFSPCAQVRQGTIDTVDLAPDYFDAVILSDVIEHVRKPLKLLNRVWELMRAGGVVLVATPSLKSLSFRLKKNEWMEFKTEHLVYFSPSNLQMAMYKTGFSRLKLYPQRKHLNIDYILGHFSRYPSDSWIARVLTRSMGALPQRLRSPAFQIGGAGMVVLGTRGDNPGPEMKRLSIIVPVYNEKATFGTVARELLKKSIPGLEKEIVIVESNSDDGSRDEVLKLKDQPGVVLVLQDSPEGKGNAVREGLRKASGDIILIQDADLEYDFRDYEALLRPIIQMRRSFVVGARHKGNSWKMRRFVDNPLMARTINLGHLILTSCFNVLHRQDMEDPFTMFKVFRKDCLYGVSLECDHFDFDMELVIKLIRQGFEPLEVPVNYVSRSFAEGKKVSFLRDPLRIAKAMLKYRFRSRHNNA